MRGLSERVLQRPVAIGVLLVAAACSASPPTGPATEPTPVASALLAGSPAARLSAGPSASAAATSSPRGPSSALDGRVFAPAALANGAPVVVGERFDLTEPSPAVRLGLLQATFEKPVQNALVTPRGADLKLVGATSGAYSDAAGRFRVPGVGSLPCVFLEVRTRAAGRNVRAFAWARPREAQLAGGVTVDLAATLVARELLRFWQRAGRDVNFASLPTADVEPLLLRVRRALAAGLPAGLAFDPGSVTMPAEAWSAQADAEDGALVLLDGLAAREPLIDREVDRLWLGCNAVVTGRRDPDQLAVFRPGREPSPSPTAAPGEAATPTPAASGTQQPAT